MALNKAVRKGLMTYNPCRMLDRTDLIQDDESKKEFLVVEEIRRLEDTECDNPNVKAAFMFACFTG